MSHLNRYALRKAQTKDHVAAGQVRLLIAPLVKRLLAYWGRSGLEKLVQCWFGAILAGSPDIQQRHKEDAIGKVCRAP